MQLHTLWQDLRYSLRGIGKDPGFAATVALTFALGIGATTAIFTVVSGVLLRPLPFSQPSRLVSIREDYGKGPNVFIASPEVVEWQHSSTRSQVAAYFDGAVNLLGDQEAERVECGSVTQSLFPLLGVQPLIGRSFLPEEDRPGGPPAVILSHSLWKRRYGGAHSILGKSVVLDEKSYTVVGVMPEGFQVPGEFHIPQELWLPFQLEEGRAHLKMLWAVGRLRTGVSVETARAELDTIFQALRRGRKVTGHVVLTEWQQEITGRVKTTLVLFLGAVGLVLLIACVNVANLLLSRGTGREKEMAVRRALGASTGRIMRQLLTESILMALAGGLLGLALASWGKSLLVAFLARSLPTVPPIPLDLRVLSFNLGLAVVCGIAFGMAPALQAGRIPVNERLKESGRGAGAGRSGGRLRDLLVVAEVALAMALLIGAGLLFHSFLRLRGMGSDTPADRILTMNLQLKGARYSSAQSQSAFFQEALENIRSVPGIQSAGATTMYGGASTEVEGHTDVQAESEWSVVSPDYFRVMGIPLLRGRNFADSDSRGAPEVAIVSQSFARRYFPNEDCVGRRLGSLFQKNGWMTIIGVVSDRRIELDSEPAPTLYTFYLQRGKSDVGETSMTLMARTIGEPMRLAAAVRSRLFSIDRTQVPSQIETLEQHMSRSIAPQRVNMALLVSFALLALLLGSAGIYGVLAHSVSRRTHEIGIRMALGADRIEITRLVIGRGLRLVVSGEAVGLAAALLLNRVISSMLFHVATTDPWTYGAVAVIWAAVGLIACYVPARRAVRVDPTVALRA
jgi:putative ABC transport system permease protein